jgi:hypothetical protein
MAALAIQSDVLSFEGISGFSVIERRRGWSPANQSKVLAVVLGVAFDATLAAVSPSEIRSVQTAPGS